MNLSSDQARIINTVTSGLLPVRGQVICAAQILQTIVDFIDGRFNEAAARTKVEEELQTTDLPVNSHPRNPSVKHLRLPEPMQRNTPSVLSCRRAALVRAVHLPTLTLPARLSAAWRSTLARRVSANAWRSL